MFYLEIKLLLIKYIIMDCLRKIQLKLVIKEVIEWKI